MKKIFQLTFLFAALALALFSCAKNELNTDQYDSAVVALKAYGPQPVVRGGTLRFIGSNLDKVVSVTIPDDNVITDIQVVSAGAHSEIRVTVPKETSAPGYPVLKLADGSTLTGKTIITYDEPITISDFTPAAYPGENITIEGDYLNLIKEVVFTKDVIVSEDDFATHTRYKIELAVPSEAKTGVLALGTLDETKIPAMNLKKAEEEALLKTLNLIETEEEFEVGTAAGTVDGEYKAAAEVTVNGDHLDLTTAVNLAGAEDVAFLVAEDGTSLKFELPAEATDGDVVLVMASGVEVVAGAITTKVPVVSAVTPAPVKNGGEITITGSDLDLVTGLSFPNSDDAEFTFAEGKITATVTEAAQEGDITLSLTNGKTVAAEIKLVKPAITAYSATEITAGDDVTITGTDLDLVESVTLGGVECEAQIAETSIILTSAATAPTGVVVLNLKNGTKVKGEQEITVKPAGKINVTELPASASVGDEIVLKGTGFNAVEAIYFGETKVTAYSKREDTEIVFTIPLELEAAAYNMKFVLTTGEEETCPTPIDVKGLTTTIVLFEGERAIGNWDSSQAVFVAGSDFGKIPYGTPLHFEYDLVAADYHMFQFCYNVDGWPKIAEPSISGTTSYVWTPTKEEYDRLYTDGLVIFGYGWILKKVYATYENQSYDPVKVGDVVLVDWNDHGGHNGYWDQPDGWGGVKTELVWKAEGDLYLKVTEGAADQKWTVCCNHQSSFSADVPKWVIADASKYVVKMDILLEGDASAADMTFNPVLGDKWPGGKGAGLFPATTEGKWVTVSIDLDLSGELDCSSGVNGFMAGGVPTGICFDNFRLSLK